MKKFLAVCAILFFCLAADAASRGGFSGGGRSSSSSSFSHSSPSVSPNRGGFNSSSAKPTAPIAPARTTTTTTVTSHSYTSRYVSPGPMYGGWGMGYGYSNGLLTGMIIGNMMHPMNTVMYVGPGAYTNNALLYPDGRVVDQRGYQVGVYQGGVFTPIANGQYIAQNVPADAGAQPIAPVQQPQPVIIKTGPSVAEVVLTCMAVFFMIMIFFMIII